MQGVAQLTTGFSNNYHCNINQLMYLYNFSFDQYFGKTKQYLYITFYVLEMIVFQYVLHH